MVVNNVQCGAPKTFFSSSKTKKKGVQPEFGGKEPVTIKKDLFKKTLNYGKNDKLLKNILKKHTENHLSST